MKKRISFKHSYPIPYVVTFELGETETLAINSRDAKIKTVHLQDRLGFFKGARAKQISL